MLTFSTNVPIARTMGIEKTFHENLQMSLREKRKFLKPMDRVWMLANGLLVGETYGCGLNILSKVDQDVCGKGLEPYMNDSTAFYVYSTAISKEWQGYGYGSILKAYFLGMLSQHYAFVLGHAKEGASLRLNQKFGAKTIQYFQNWYDTGGVYVLYKLELS